MRAAALRVLSSCVRATADEWSGSRSIEGSPSHGERGEGSGGSGGEAAEAEPAEKALGAFFLDLLGES